MKAAGLTHLNLDGTIIDGDYVAAPRTQPRRPLVVRQHRDHDGNVQVISAPDGWPIWVSPVRSGREHNTTCARRHGLIGTLDRIAAELNVPNYRRARVAGFVLFVAALDGNLVSSRDWLRVAGAGRRLLAAAME